MNVVRCSGKSKHFFDGDVYQVCPHCGAPVDNSPQQTSGSLKEKRRGVFGRRNKESSQSSRKNSVSKDISVKEVSKATQDDKRISFKEKEKSREAWSISHNTKSEQKKKGDLTLDIWQETAESAQAPEKDNKSEEIGADNVAVPDSAEDNMSRTNLTSQETAREENVSSQSLLEKVRNASASSDEKTMSYFSAITGAASPSAPVSKKPAQSDPVVGWLVAVHGEHFGESFCIGAGMNSIGRNESNRIILNRDLSVSREKHALITYEPKHRKFYIKPGDSSGLTYLNDEYITETKQLTANDRIELGNSLFVFVPLCGENFTWEDYMKG